jgi:hypothetical protein
VSPTVPPDAAADAHAQGPADLGSELSELSVTADGLSAAFELIADSCGESDERLHAIASRLACTMVATADGLNMALSAASARVGAADDRLGLELSELSLTADGMSAAFEIIADSYSTSDARLHGLALRLTFTMVATANDLAMALSEAAARVADEGRAP